MAMVNPALLNLASAAQVKDSRWLTLEVCREFQRNKCTRTDTECKFAHPPPHVEVQNGRVTACFDSIKGKCQRKEPPCKYLHPPQHLREQLLQNGRNNLILKNLQLQAAQQAAMNHGMIPAGIIPIAGIGKTAVALPSTVFPTGQYPPMLGHPYLSNTGNSTTAVYNPYISTGMPTIAVAGAQTNGESPTLMSQPHGGVIPSAVANAAQATKLTRPDRLEPHMVEVLTGKKRPRDEELVLSQNPVMVGPYKRIAVADAKGLPTMYQPISNIAYQQTLASMQSLQQPQFIPVSLPMVAQEMAPAPMVTAPPLPGSLIPNNAHSVNYFDDNKQLLDTLPVCKDFKIGLCQRPTCKYIHVLEDYVEVTDGRVTVCRDAVRGKCSRPTCKYYHIPVPLPPSE